MSCEPEQSVSEREGPLGLRLTRDVAPHRTGDIVSQVLH